MADDSMVAEIASLLDQCSPEELNNIVQSLEGGLSPEVGGESNGPVQVQTKVAPVPPAAPPPAGNGRRPNPGVKRAGNTGAAADDAVVSMEEMKQLLQQHSDSVLSEVRRMIPAGGSVQGGTAGNQLDMETLTKILAMRDREVKELETRLSELNNHLSEKDQRVSQLAGELDSTIREVRHRQLDLEFQQLKLDERMRSNNELEQAQRDLSARVDEASLNARHAALDADMSRTTPRSVRVQGSLPWTLRKNRPVVGTL